MRGAGSAASASAPEAGDRPLVPAAADPLPPGARALQTLTRRADFLRAARGRRANRPGLGLQARRRSADGPEVRVGFTCSRKVGNAVARNRAKRRLREVAWRMLPVLAQPGWDYVLIGRAEVTAERPFEQLAADLAAALRAVHRERR